MKPQTIGRVLGIGMRVAGRMAGQRIAAGAQSGASAGARPVTIDADAVRASGRTAGRATGAAARGVGGFLRPFRRVGNIILLEVVGAFFFLFVILFGTWAWRLRDQAAHGPDHSRFLVYTAMTLLFLYLSGSSFWRARRK
jgi:glycerol uptake facilitator-like aquaporin